MSPSRQTIIIKKKTKLFHDPKSSKNKKGKKKESFGHVFSILKTKMSKKDGSPQLPTHFQPLFSVLASAASSHVVLAHKSQDSPTVQKEESKCRV
jgi:hypothetical protein